MSTPATKGTTYQGWTNYETWAVGLWIDNDEPLYNRAVTMARKVNRRADVNGEVDGGVAPFTYKRSATGALAEELTKWIKGKAPELGSTLWADLLGAALSEVDWLELAEHYLDVVREAAR